VESFQVSKDAGYKIVAHMMPGLPTMNPDGDIADFKKLFQDEDLKPDMLKIYPSLVLQHTPLYQEYLQGKYVPYSDDDMIRVLTEAKKMIPRWVRVMRVQREISPGEIIAGPKSGNLRQIVHNNLKRQGLTCRCIRCREIGSANPQNEILMHRENYASSGGDEVFLSYDDSQDRIYGFLRLRRPSSKAHRKEIMDNTCIVRELHVYGKSLKIGEREDGQIQHSGLGKNLMGEAERISSEEFDAKKILVISAVGTREYYRKLGYLPDGPYMAKKLE
jgi:elongator complex protein 3